MLSSFLKTGVISAIFIKFGNLLSSRQSLKIAVIENDILFDRSQVTGDNVHHRLHDGDQLATYNQLLQRRNRFAPVVAGAKNWVVGRAIPEGNFIWQDVKYVIHMRLLSPFFSINKEISLDLVVKFNFEQDT